jgi:hypothetical protein
MLEAQSLSSASALIPLRIHSCYLIRSMLNCVFVLSRITREGTVVGLTQSLIHTEGAVYSEISCTLKLPLS